MEERNSQVLLRFLHSLKDSPISHLFWVGDIFDLWIAAHHHFIEQYQPIIQAVRELVKRGVEVHYFEGNHDLYLREFWEKQVGVTIHPGPQVFQLGPWRVAVEHGDQMDPEDRGYRALRWTLRTPPVRWALTHAPSRGIGWLGERVSRASRYYTSQMKTISQQRSTNLLHDYAQRLLDQQEFDFLITGHIHVRDVFEVSHQQKRSVSINLGAWFDEAKALELTEDGFQFISCSP